jgi:hypothetical protein
MRRLQLWRPRVGIGRKRGDPGAGATGARSLYWRVKQRFRMKAIPDVASWFETALRASSPEGLAFAQLVRTSSRVEAAGRVLKDGLRHDRCHDIAFPRHEMPE